MKMKKIKNIHGKKVWTPIEERKNLKELIEYEISETYESDKKTKKIYQKIRKLEEELEKTITVNERKLLNEISNLQDEVAYNYQQYFYKTLWKMLDDWNF